MTLYLLDTNIVSYYIRRSAPALEARLNEEIRRQTVSISVLTRAELRFGQAGMDPDDRRSGFIDQFLLRIPNLEWSIQAADQYGQAKSHLKRVGQPIGELDTQIAAHALAENLILVTHNTRHFERVPGLKLEDWMT